MTTICSLAVIAASLLVAQFIPFSTAEVCDLSPDPGPCKASIEHYYYNQKTGDCETFIYGGCGGNGNNFATKEKCEDVCKTVCEESPDSGPCKGQIKNYYYNHKTGNCETFIYGGCGGNENNFDTKEKCEAVCKTVPVCEQPQDPGSCKAYVKHYYYDQETETCKDFIYGGCQGNGNNFETKGECESTCISVCHQPPKNGPCRAHVKRYYYDQMEKTCKQFIYGGCDGNENNFKTKEECERTCQSVCELPPDRGPCRGHMLRYYYDQNAKTCKEFIYGGCQGNGNNFLTKKQCERTCKSAKGTSPMWDYFWMLSLDDEHMFS